MGVLFGRRIANLDDLIEAAGGRPRSAKASMPTTRRETLQASVKWACLRLRADLISTTPLDVFKRINGVQVEMPRPAVFTAPGGGKLELEEWLYSSQFDLDDVGNCVGRITAKDGAGLPLSIELVPISTVTIRVSKGVVTVLTDGKKIPEDVLWHERQYTTSGSPVGLSPTWFAAFTMGIYLSAEQFAAEWFAGSGIPAAHFRNTEALVTPAQSVEIKRRFESQVANGGTLVTGKDWEYTVMGAKASESAFLEATKATGPELCRFYGVPGDMVDVTTDSSAITYANVVQRNLQLLVTNLGPAYVRREAMFSHRLLPAPRYAKFNTDALLRMDPQSRFLQFKTGIDARFLAPSEARELDNRQPFTEEQYDEFDRLFSSRQTVPAKEAA